MTFVIRIGKTTYLVSELPCTRMYKNYENTLYVIVNEWSIILEVSEKEKQAGR